MSGIDGILFDLGDTLLDFGPVDTIDLFEQGAQRTYAYLEELHAPLPHFSVYHQKQLRAVRRAYAWSHLIRREFNALDVMAKMIEKMGFTLSDEQLEELAWRWYEPLSLQATVEPGTDAMLAAFDDQGITLGVVSNTFIPGGVLDRHLKQAGLLDYLEPRIYSCDIRYRKPHPKIFHCALAAAGLDPATTLFVGDTPSADVRGAKRVGLISVLKDPDGRHDGERLKPDYTIRSLAELPEIVRRYA